MLSRRDEEIVRVTGIWRAVGAASSAHLKRLKIGDPTAQGVSTESMILEAVPVIPRSASDGNPVHSDLDLYRRVINRNNRLLLMISELVIVKRICSRCPLTDSRRQRAITVR